MIFDDELNLPVESAEVEAEDVTPSAAETPEYYVSVDLDLDETHDEPPTAFDDFSGDFDISESAPAEEIVVPAPDKDDAMPDLAPAAPDYLSPDDLVDINEGPDAGPAMSDAENIPVESQAPAQEPAETESAVQSSHDPLDTPSFKKDLQIVLSYMDRLLEALPDEKIEEFARSEQFDTYKKVFKELGLV